jgi:putative molybdopterin biosynthesis protein
LHALPLLEADNLARIEETAGYGLMPQHFDRLPDRRIETGAAGIEMGNLAVAAALASGVADVGVGIEAAARRLRLDFIPLFVEDYYLLGKRETFERADFEAIVASLKSEKFTAKVRGIPGYDTSRTGEISNVSELLDETCETK